MLLRDPVHGLVSFDGEYERIALLLLETPELQRLRRIRQLGLAPLVFPGAEHTRFAHALGAAHVMLRFQERVRALMPSLPFSAHPTEEELTDAFAASMLHDLGHGPLSHLFEELIPGGKSHEGWTCDILLSSTTCVHRALEGFSAGMSRRVAGLLQHRHRLEYLAQATSGSLDVDRCDYLLRDSHMTGVRYGSFDLDWLIRAICVHQLEADHWVLAVEGRKGLPPFEKFLLGRHFMYRQVYHHKAVRAAETLVRGIFARLFFLIREGSLPFLRELEHPIPKALLSGARGEQVSLDDYLALDDPTLQVGMAAWEKSSDRILSDLCSRFRTRRLPKTLRLDQEQEPERAYEVACDVARSRGFDPKYYVRLDRASDTPYWESKDGVNALWVREHASLLPGGENEAHPLSEVSTILDGVTNQSFQSPRLIFPPELRDILVHELAQRPLP